MHFNEYEGVVLRNSDSSSDSSNFDLQCRKSETICTNRKPILLSTTDSDGDEKSRHSDTQLFKAYVPVAKDVDGTTKPADSQSKPARKLHSKSFSLTENRIVAAIGSNLFHQNRELWEKRAELQSQHSLTTPRILSRNRIAPDLVMDLPFPVNKDEPIHSSRESLDSNECSESSLNAIEDMTSAERFAAQNQCTLKKNERYSEGSSGHLEPADTKKEVKLDFKSTSSSEKPKAEVKPQESTLKKDVGGDKLDGLVVTDELLRIDEEPKNGTITGTDRDSEGTSLSTSMQDKSPIPQRNTKKFVSQFADMHLTGGCLTASSAIPSVDSITVASSSDKLPLSSFKPHVKVKPQVLRKPLILPPTTPEMAKRNKD